MYWDHERFQTHCRFCNKTLEADSAAEAIELVEEHEKTDCPKRKVVAK
jgi:hypothetical protein